MAAGDLVTVPIKDGAGATRNLQFVEQTDGTLAPANVVETKGEKAVQILNETNLAGGSLTLGAPPAYFRVINTGDTDLVFTVNGLAFPVPAKAALQTGVGGTPSTDVPVTGSSTFSFQRLV